MKLEEVCESLLDNADLRVDFSAFPAVTLEMYIQGTVNDKFWKVIFECSQVVHMETELDDDSSSNDFFVILQASVIETTKKELAPAIQCRMERLQVDDPAWKLQLYGCISLSLITTNFTWKVVELSENEYKEAYA